MGNDGVMHFSQSLTYNAPAPAVYAMLIDPDFRNAVLTAQSGVNQEVVVRDVEPGLEVHLSQAQPTSGVPSFAKKFVGEQIRIDQQELWTSPLEANLNLTLPGNPGQLAGTIKLLDVNGATEQQIVGELTVPIPFLGSKLEALIADLLIKALLVEGRVGESWLLDNPLIG
jgi:hypothetical protein